MREFSDNQYPDLLISGGPLATAFFALQKRLNELFDPSIFSHKVIPPRATGHDWSNLTERMPMVAIGWMGMPTSAQTGIAFRGDIQFAVILLTRQDIGNAAYLGDGTLPGVMGLSAIAACGLHGYKIPEVGTCRVEHLASAGEQEWLPGDVVSVQLQVTIPQVSFSEPQMLAQLDSLKLMVQKYTNEKGQPL